MKDKAKQANTVRPPVVAIMGHIDHGKSTLLDYIRNTNITAREAGGITQHISAYEVNHKSLPAGQAGEKGIEEKITFLDTPGHEAFSSMRARGAKIADIAILIVAADDGAKPQTIEAWKSIKESGVPVIVAINKTDKPGANIEQTKASLAEKEIYLENYGGNIPFVPISAKTGAGVDELLSMISLVAEMEGWKGDATVPAEGFVLEADVDKRRGIQATLIIKNGTLKRGQTIATGDSTCPVKIMENFAGKTISEASFSSPVRLVGFDTLPRVGEIFQTFNKKEEALEYLAKEKNKSTTKEKKAENEEENVKNIALIIKADTAGSIEAIEKELGKVKAEGAKFLIVSKGVGAISERDITSTADAPNTLIAGFNVKTESGAAQMAEQKGVSIGVFNIIYQLTEWLQAEMEKRRPRIEEESTIGKAKILKTFNRTKEKQVVGGRVQEGKVSMHARLKILRREGEIGRGRVVELQQNKSKTGSVEEGTEFGMMIESKVELAPGDIIEAFEVVTR